LDLCHYYLHDFEGHHYYSRNCAGAITILHLFEICHFVRQTPSVAHLQAYRRPPYFRMDGFSLPPKDKAADAFCLRLPQARSSTSPSPTANPRTPGPRRLPSVAHHRRPLEMKSTASSSSSSQIGDLPKIECPRCHIKVIKTKSRKDEVYYKCPNHFKTVCWL
jgi:ssDNA-binding Zn-finger/Zn-ribbon topoisomerase 1